MKACLKQFRGAFLFSIAMFVICGLAYPLALTGIAQVSMPTKANGSIVEVKGKAVASSLVGQDFQDERLFHCRPSAYNYNTYTKEEQETGTYAGVSSGSNNYANSNPDLVKRIENDVEAFLAKNPTVQKQDIPSDIVTASGSGLDPHISVQAALVQIDRIVSNTGLTNAEVESLIEQHTDGKAFGILGEETINVVLLNLELAQKIGMIASDK